MRDLISETLKKYAHKSELNVSTLQRYIKMKFSVKLEEEVISRRLSTLKRQAA